MCLPSITFEMNFNEHRTSCNVPEYRHGLTCYIYFSFSKCQCCHYDLKGQLICFLCMIICLCYAHLLPQLNDLLPEIPQCISFEHLFAVLSFLMRDLQNNFDVIRKPELVVRK
jgi:hypothetical protein